MVTTHESCSILLALMSCPALSSQVNHYFSDIESQIWGGWCTRHGTQCDLDEEKDRHKAYNLQSTVRHFLLNGLLT